MAILLTAMAGGQRPMGASCGWPTTDLRYWRVANAVCFQRLQIRSFDASGGRGPVYGLRGGWWSGTVVNPTYGTCGGSDPRISFWISAQHYSYIDVWRALAQGLWTSSIVIDLIPVDFNGSSSLVGIFVGPELTSVPATLLPTVRRISYPGSCANPVAWSITVRDDGSYSIV